jgi:hypothetical protein
MEKPFEWLSNEEKLKKISQSTAGVFEVISKNWPTNPLEVAEALNDEGKDKSLSAKYLYHFKKLHKLKLVRMKKIGNTYIAWPTEVEKLRVIKEILKGA